MSTVPRPEYPRPQFVRPDWLCLNGPWQFEIDPGDSGLERGVATRELGGTITVPFCPEAPLSGVGNTDFLNAVWYRRTVQIPAAWAGRDVLLHFGAVDYDATVWVNGTEVIRHRGGYTPFSAELASVAKAGESITIVIRARDPHRRPMALGKQSPEFANAGCLYTRTTGIWQTVWLEPVPKSYLKRPRITPDLPNGRFTIVQPIARGRAGMQFRATLKAGDKTIATKTVFADAGLSAWLDLDVPPADRRPWAIGDPFLYDIDLELLDASGKTIDAVRSYAGLRSISIDGPAIRINGKSVFQRLVLDQGYYPDGILTAPTDADLVRDIELSMAAGFNGARLHQKVFEERFLYHADRLGYLCWGEFADWGCAVRGTGDDNQQPGPSYVAQWLEAVERDYSHPCIVGWCPLNETYQNLHDRITDLDDVTRAMFLTTKAIDPMRPVLDTSGYSHRVIETDVYDAHDYAQDPTVMAANHAGMAAGRPMINLVGDTRKAMSVGYRDQPYFVSEFGGMRWNPEAVPGDASWGYGERPKTLDEFFTRFEGLCDVLLNHPLHFGYCYTQLTDVFQEQNGVIHFDRRLKYDLARMHAIQSKRAAIED